MNGFYDGEKKWKDKIKAKIKQLEEQIVEGVFTEKDKKILAKITILEELLEEEK